MKKRVTFSVDEDVFEGLKEVPRGVSVSEIVSWFLKAIITDIQGTSDEEFRKFMDNDPRGKEVRKYLQEKLLPVLDKVDDGVDNVKGSTLYSWANGGSMHAYKINGVWRFDMEEIEEWIKKGKVYLTLHEGRQRRRLIIRI